MTAIGMKFSRIKTKESTASIIAGIAGLLGFQVFYFVLVVRLAIVLQQSAFTLFFWLFYCLWAVLGFSMFLRRPKKERRKAQDAFLIFAILLFVSLGIAALNHSFLPIPTSFPGFTAGIAIYGIVALMIRLRVKI